MRFVDVIEAKAEGNELSTQDIEAMITDYVAGKIPDYQMSAMCMAILQKGMNARESTDLTLAMMRSGDVVDLSDLPGVKLDKHSTGGVGDTTTLVVGPLVAACGGTVAKMSGRGLGHTGGTIDKLEAIPGTNVSLPIEQFKSIVRANGLAVTGQTGNLVPADKKMYALRDVTATIRSIPLIASSIMSKKLASGADAIVLDVKTGTGAFMRTKEEAFELARLMVDIGTLAGRKVRAVVTDMNQPLGTAVGNALEVEEAVALLSGQLEEQDPLYEVCMILGSSMLELAGLAETEADARAKLREAIVTGAGLEKLRAMISLQGGDASFLSIEGMKRLTAVKRHAFVLAEKCGYVTSMNAEGIGTAAQLLGAGRATKEDTIDPAVGLVMKVRCGAKVEAGDVLADLYVNDDRYLQDSINLLTASIHISEELTELAPMIYGVVS
ncbi:MAG: thymidine phosphorylase [Solobacterium sp.]|nr:thymidine phosphorylase [Solobacterium sp.]